jgi:predicted O-methyltransferase YrrM
MWYRIRTFLVYWLTSKHKKGFGIHSPFLFDLITLVFNDKSDKKAYRLAEIIRRDYLTSKRAIMVQDFGAGKNSGPRFVREICRDSSVPEKYGELLYRLCNHFKPETILELGTSCGISTLYLASGNPMARVITLEGCPETAILAQNTFTKTQLENISLINGTFEELLPLTFFDLKHLGFVFFDGNHSYEATMNYFNQCVFFSKPDSIFVFDDIYWSPEMTKAWNEIILHPRVTLSLDLWRMGIVFFKAELKKEHYIIRY